jgi:hypothetical protein
VSDNTGGRKYQGVARGETTNAIWAQSKVVTDMPMPRWYPKRAPMVALRGTIHVTHAK